MTLHISYEADGFPAGLPFRNGSFNLSMSWDKLLWAALTVGRPNRQFVFSHGIPSLHEALFRLSLVRMSLEQTSPNGRVLWRTEAAKSLDPSEKGAVNYFLGLAVAKLFAAELLDTPWLLHLDVFRSQLNPALLKGRSRPDLVGQKTSGEWIALECKGRASTPNEDARTKAKTQAQRVISIGGVAPVFAIGAITYFRNDTLQFFWRDPEIDPSVKNKVVVPVIDGMWSHYFAPILELMRSSDRKTIGKIVWARVEEADIDIAVREEVWKVVQENAAEAKLVAERIAKVDGEDSLQRLDWHFNVDGIAVRAGNSWTNPYVDIEMERRR